MNFKAPRLTQIPTKQWIIYYIAPGALKACGCGDICDIPKELIDNEIHWSLENLYEAAQEISEDFIILDIHEHHVSTIFSEVSNEIELTQAVK